MPIVYCIYAHRIYIVFPQYSHSISSNTLPVMTSSMKCLMGPLEGKSLMR